MSVDINKVQEILGDEAGTLVKPRFKNDPEREFTVAGRRFCRPRLGAIRTASRAFCAACRRFTANGRLRGTGYLSILPVDQGIEHSAGASLRRIRSISTPKISSSSPSRAAATPWPRPLACWARSPANTRTRSRSS